MAQEIETVIVPVGITLQRTDDRYYGDHGWLRTYHSFSFADYYDPTNVSWGALRVVNDDRVDPAAGFPTYPHADMEIISYVLEGQLEHRDSLGNHGVVEPGGVQFMSAGTGIRHSEYNASQADGLHFLQMWVLPRRAGLKPRYGQRNFSRDDRRNRWLDIASGIDSVRAPVALDRDAVFSVARLEGTTIGRAISAERLGFLFVADGDVSVRTASAERECVFTLGAGDSLRMAGAHTLTCDGTAEIVLWDVSPLLA